MHDKSVIDIHAKSLPEAWEKSVLECWENGLTFKTEYDKPEDPPSRDCVARLVVSDPLSEPRIHKAMPAGIEDLEIYVQEVLHGVHDNWIAPEEGRWEYTYHERLFDYRVGQLGAVNQIEKLINKLAEAPHTRRAQAVTWQAWQDNDCYDPPCLQRLWLRVQEATDDQPERLNMNIIMRSNDAFKAAFMNMYAFTELQAMIAARLSEKLGREIQVGRYIHQADSYHIYGSYFDEFEIFLKQCESTPIEKRLIDSTEVQYFLDGGKITLFNNTQTPIPLPLADRIRLYHEIPDDRRSELNATLVEEVQKAK